MGIIMPRPEEAQGFMLPCIAATELKNVSYLLSEDAEYLRTEKNKGILRWDLQLDGGIFGPKATIVTYCYGMKYDKSLAVIPAGPSQ
jgi:hypothetical protein